MNNTICLTHLSLSLILALIVFLYIPLGALKQRIAAGNLKLGKKGASEND